MRLDMSGVDKAGELLPEGQYNFTVTEATMSDKPAGPYMTLKCKVSDGEEFAGRVVFDGCSFGEKSRSFVKRLLEGVTGTPWDSDDMEFEPSDLPGLQFDAIVSHVPRSDQPNVLQAKITTFLAEV